MSANMAAMSGLQTLWIALVDAGLLGIAFTAWADFRLSRDPVALRFFVGLTAFAGISIPLFFL